MASTSPRLSKKCSRRGGICPSEPAETHKGAPVRSLLPRQTKNTTWMPGMPSGLRFVQYAMCRFNTSWRLLIQLYHDVRVGIYISKSVTGCRFAVWGSNLAFGLIAPLAIRSIVIGLEFIKAELRHQELQLLKCSLYYPAEPLVPFVYQ